MSDEPTGAAPGVPGCLFCGIVSGAVPARILGETAHSVAFADIAPGAPTHVLVVPRAHVRDASVIGPEHGEVLADMVGLARRCAEEEGVAESGYRLVMNVGEDAGNSVPHLHLHVLGGRPLSWPPG